MKKVLLFCVELLFLVLLASCSSASGAEKNDRPGTLPSGEVDPPVSPLPGDPAEGEILSAFSASFLSALSEGKKDENIAFSPASLYLALSMVSEGAAGGTAEEFSAFLRVPEGGSSQKVCAALSKLLDLSGGGTFLTSANAVWIDDSLTVLPSFSGALRSGYSASFFTTDFSLQKSVDEVNSWVKETTRGRIDSLLERPDATIRLLLADSIYLNAEWVTPFPSGMTVKKPFRGARKTADVPTMTNTLTAGYLSDGDAFAVSLPYAGSGLVFVAVCPKNGQTPAEYYSARPDLSSLLSRMSKGEIFLSLPKFEQEAKMDLTDLLARSGLATALSPAADFSALSSEPLHIDEVLQKICVRVDEKGTEAAAVTSVVMRKNALAAGSNVELVFDAPFFWGIVDAKSGIPLFAGVINDLG